MKPCEGFRVEACHEGWSRTRGGACRMWLDQVEGLGSQFFRLDSA